MAGQGPEQLWKMLDRKGTGTIKPEDVPEERRERFTKMLELADSNKDGALSREEFEKFAARMMPPGGPGRERPKAHRAPQVNARVNAARKVALTVNASPKAGPTASAPSWPT